ncbi:MAG TPA: ABC transporter ATP-binding protein, partial [Ktedonobacterales bacterium]|nr:ABC transporter ATP-binding protein [Ktedonobacterales bacterium]
DDLVSAIDAIHREGSLSFLLVEQDVQIALERADRGYVIENGRIVVSGPGAELLGRSEVRAAYLGE